MCCTCCVVNLYSDVAVVQAILSAEQDEIDIDIMVQLLAPLLNSQHFLIEELKTAYRSITCQNGFVFVFAEVSPITFLNACQQAFSFALQCIPQGTPFCMSCSALFNSC